MITEQFLNSCYHLVLAKTPNDNIVQSDKRYFSNILDILNIYTSKKDIEIPINIQNKFTCLKKICELKLKDKTKEYILDMILSSNKYSELKDFIENISKTDISVQDIESIIEQISIRNKISSLFYSNYEMLNEFFTNIKNGNFDSNDDLINNYENFIRNQHSLIMEYDRNDKNKNSSTLDINNDEWDEIKEQIKQKYDKKNKVPTGYSVFDDFVLYGGFDPGRLYMFGGGSGAGKSTLLINFMRNAAEAYRLRELVKTKEEKIESEENILIYVTLENTIDETVFRLYMSIVEKNQDAALEDIHNGIDIKKIVSNYFKEGKTNILLRFFPAYTISCFDLMSVLDEAVLKYGKNKIKGLYLDYLDLLISHRQHELYRLELSYIAATLKIVSNHYGIPVITGTQLNKSIYTIAGSNDLNLGQISEAIKKAEHSDFVLLMGLDSIDADLVHGKVGKNRCGKNNINIEFRYDFSKYKLLNCYQETTTTKEEVNEAIQKFDLSNMFKENSALDIGEI